MSFYFFFFQAEDGIRDDLVTGVQTCALPICLSFGSSPTICGAPQIVGDDPKLKQVSVALSRAAGTDATVLLEGESGTGKRSEERRVGKEGRSRWAPYH